MSFMSSAVSMTKTLHHVGCGVNDIIAPEMVWPRKPGAPKIWRPALCEGLIVSRPRLSRAELPKKAPKPLKNRRRRPMQRPSFGAQGESGLFRPVAVQARAVRLEPGFGAVRLRARAAEEAPEFRRMIEVDEMGDLVRREIVEHERRREDQA